MVHGEAERLQPSPPPTLLVLRGIPYLSKHRGDRVKRLGDFLNMESFDLALLEEVGRAELVWNPGWDGGGWGHRRGLFPGVGEGGRRQTGILTPSLRCGVSRTSST